MKKQCSKCGKAKKGEPLWRRYGEEGLLCIFCIQTHTDFTHYFSYEGQTGDEVKEEKC